MAVTGQVNNIKVNERYDYTLLHRLVAAKVTSSGSTTTLTIPWNTYDGLGEGHSRP
ncbi:MAG TPA: hypothetical protein VFE96_02485 [Candidatus Bathyarchaeia archaeon]|nr:hypothetical protein [Candidatus Bathyarchaeia archaeon]